MQPWKINQEIYHRTSPIPDSIEGKEVVVWDRSTMTTDEFADSVITYFYPTTSTVLNYPQKSYAVAIIYASLLNQYFGEDLVVALRDPELLYNNDKFFVPYQTDTEAYNNIVMQLTKRGLWEFEKNTSEQVQITVTSFKHEFLIDYTSE